MCDTDIAKLYIESVETSAKIFSRDLVQLEISPKSFNKHESANEPFSRYFYFFAQVIISSYFY